MRILHLPTAVGNNAYSLSRGERALGVESDVLVARAAGFQYPADMHLHFERLPLWRQLGPLLRTFLRIRDQYDVFHFNFGRSLFTHRYLGWWPHLDLPYYGAGAKLFVTYNGCDGRLASEVGVRNPHSPCRPGHCGQMDNWSRCDEAIRRRGIRKMARYVEAMWAVNPDLVAALPEAKRAFLPYAVAMDSLPHRPPAFDGPVLTVVHAPTDRTIKGTPFVEEAVARIEAESPGALRLVLVENLPHAEALQRYAEADLVIDQLRIGWYGAFAVEAMAMGKPVICYLHEADLGRVPEAMRVDLRSAVIPADPLSLTEVLRRCVADRAWLRATAEAAAAYARRWHEPRRVAEITLAAYQAAGAR